MKSFYVIYEVDKDEFQTVLLYVGPRDLAKIKEAIVEYNEGMPSESSVLLCKYVTADDDVYEKLLAYYEKGYDEDDPDFDDAIDRIAKSAKTFYQTNYDFNEVVEFRLAEEQGLRPGDPGYDDKFDEVSDEFSSSRAKYSRWLRKYVDHLFRNWK